MELSRKWCWLILTIPAFMLVGFLAWVGNPLGPMPEALPALESDSQVRVEVAPWLVFYPVGAQPTAGLIFYPGGRVDPQPMQSAYTASKAWILSFTRSLAKEYAHSSVGVFAFNPGMMDTDMLLNVEVVAGYESRLDRFETVMSALSQPVEIPARKAVWLASSETDGRTGLVERELTRWKMLRGALREAANKLFNRPARSFDIRITSVPSAFPGNLDERL